MPPETSNPLPQKYAWRTTDRTTLPERAAVDRVHDYREIYGSLDEAEVIAQARRCIQCPYPLCAQACPLSNRIPEWMGLAAEGRFLEAAAASRCTSNMPEVCSRVCPQERLCEGGCILNTKGEPVSIGAIERFINEYAFYHGDGERLCAPPNGCLVAVIGSGPGGLACADELATLGYAVTVFEAQPIPGGLLINGIPSFKLEKSVVERRIDTLAKRGVVFRLNQKIGTDVSLADLRRQHDAVFFGIGAQNPKPADVPGEKLKGVIAALPFLIEKNVKSPLIDISPVDVTGKKVVVLGGGDTAMDCLRTSLRASAASSICLYRRDLGNMPARPKEYANAVDEGAEFRFLTNPVEIVGNPRGEVTAVRCVRMELGEADASGRRRPRPVPDSEFLVPADIVIVAYGFDPVPFPPDSEFAAIATNEWGGVIVDEMQMTSVPGVFAGGDSVRGPSLVVHAIRDARRAAAGIDRYLAARRKPAAVPA